MKEFKVGDRVKIYGHKSSPGWAPISGTVTDIWSSAAGNEGSGMTLPVDCGLLGIFWAHRKQCRLLKKKAKAVKPLRVWLQKEKVLERNCQPVVYPLEGWTPFIELLPDHVLVNQEIIAKAWEEHSGCTSEFAKAIGLEWK